MIVITALLIGGCKPEADNPYQFHKPPSIQAKMQGDSVYAVIETPAGATAAIHFDPVTKTFDQEQQAVNFLAYPANFGFVSGTQVDSTWDNSGKALEIMVMMSALSPGSVLPVKPLGVLLLKTPRGKREVIVAVPTNQELQSVKAGSFVDLITTHDPIRFILQNWFLHSDRSGTTQLVGWQDDQYAQSLIRQWRIPD